MMRKMIRQWRARRDFAEHASRLGYSRGPAESFNAFRARVAHSTATQFRRPITVEDALEHLEQIRPLGVAMGDLLADMMAAVKGRTL